MSLNRTTVRILLVIMCSLALFGLAAGCTKKGSSGLTFYEFYDPT